MTRPQRFAIACIALYRRLLSPLFPPACRYEPTCSQYASEAIARFGVLQGARLGLLRLLRCHPWHASGYDPVPPTISLKGPR